jgi:hypothetical protein
MSTAARLGRRFGNGLYRVAFPVYRLLYNASKAYAFGIHIMASSDQTSPEVATKMARRPHLQNRGVVGRRRE